MTTTTRAQRILALLAKAPNTKFTLADIKRHVDPDALTSSVSGTISTLAARGAVERVGYGRGNVTYRHQPGGAPPPLQHALRAKAAPQRAAKAAKARRAAAANFPAAPGTVSTTHCPKRRASEDIADDIAAFQQRGGHIEKLGITQVFHHSARTADHDD